MMSLIKTAGSYLPKVGVSVGVVIGSVFAIAPAFAAPDSVFDPILDELATSAAPIRLPSMVPADVELHPLSREVYPGLNILDLGTQPECRAESCLGLKIVTVAEPGPWPAPEDQRLIPLTEVVFANDVQGYFSAADGFGSLEWMQDDSLYILIYSENMFSYENAIAMANSMIDESPISAAQ